MSFRSWTEYLLCARLIKSWRFGDTDPVLSCSYIETDCNSTWWCYHGGKPRMLWAYRGGALNPLRSGKTSWRRCHLACPITITVIYWTVFIMVMYTLKTLISTLAHLIFTTMLRGRHCHPHFRNEETKAKRNSLTFPRLHSCRVAELWFKRRRV